jgi:hypothetical protein
MYSTKKFEIVRHQIGPYGKETDSLLFTSENEADIMNKLNEPAIYEVREQLTVHNNHTNQWDYAWRCLRQLKYVKVWD